jgi:glucokinase
MNRFGYEPPIRNGIGGFFVDRYIGLDIGGTKTLGVLYDEEGRELKRVKKKTKAASGIDTVTSQIFRVVDELIEEMDGDLKGIGAGSPGIIVDESVIAFSPNIPFANFDLGSYMRERYKVPFVLGNDVNVAMFGEWKASGLNNASNVLGIFVGTGVGGAIIIDKHLYTGQGGAGEIGHMIVNPGGITCGCGSHGCLEAYASKTGIQKAVVAGIRKGRQTCLKDYLEIDGAIVKSSSIRKAYLEEDPLAMEVVGDAAKYLGIATANLVNVFHPDLIIFGGGVMEALGAELMDLIVGEANRHAMIGLMGEVSFKLSHLGDNAGVYGAYQLILNK